MKSSSSCYLTCAPALGWLRRCIYKYVCYGCRARRLLAEQLSKLPASSTSATIVSLREDLQEILRRYTDTSLLMSTRNAALSTASAHFLQRTTMHSSTRAPGASNPYSTRTQSAFLMASRPLAAASVPSPFPSAVAVGSAWQRAGLVRAPSNVSAAGMHSMQQYKQ